MKHCGVLWVASLAKNQGHLLTGQVTHFGVHLDAVRKGIWRKPRAVDDVVSEIYSRQSVTMVPEDAGVTA